MDKHSQPWHKSSYSTNTSDCVEVRGREACTDVRDTKHREAGHITVSRDAWSAFLATAKQ